MANAVTHLKLTPVTSHASATVTVAGTAVTSGQASGPIALEMGANAVTVRVTAQDTTTTQDYTVTVTRQAATPVFRPITGGPPAQGALWSAMLTVGVHSLFRGCRTGSGVACTTGLTDNTFRFDGTDYTVDAIQLNNGGALRFKVNASLPVAKRRLVLFVGDTAYTGWDATFEARTTPARTVLNWVGTGLSWSAQEQVLLTLVELPTVSLHVSRNPVTEGGATTVEARLKKGGEAYRPEGGSTAHIRLLVRRGTLETGDVQSLLTLATQQTDSIPIPIYGSSWRGTFSTYNIKTVSDRDADDETFTVELAPLPSGYVRGDPAAVVITIRDPDTIEGLMLRDLRLRRQ